MRTLGTLSIALYLCAGCAGAPSPPDGVTEGATLDELVREARERAGVPALGVVVARADAAPRIAVDGVRRSGADGVVQPEDAWHWGSITKSMTATLAARLVERGDVAWDTTVGERLGDLAPAMQPGYRDATLLHLLSHAAGLQANLPMARFGEFAAAPEDVLGERLRWTRLALAQEPHAAPGADFHYSNNGTIVAAAMLEAATGESWEDLMRREVFEPLGLAGAGFGPPQGDAPRGHVRRGDAHLPVPPMADNPGAFGPAGRVHMPLADMARYLQVHLTRPADFLTPESFDVLHTPHFEGPYALGWFRMTPDSLWHNGSNTMWYAEAGVNEGAGVVAAVVVNDGDIASVSPVVSGLLRELLESPR